MRLQRLRDLTRRMSLSLRPATLEDADDLIRANRDSVAYHAPWVQAFTDRVGFDAWFAQADPARGTGSKVALIAREAVSGGVVGLVNLNEIVRFSFQSAYLGYYGNGGVRRVRPDDWRRCGRRSSTPSTRSACTGWRPTSSRPIGDPSPWSAGLGFRLEGFLAALSQDRWPMARPRALDDPRRRICPNLRALAASPRRQTPNHLGR